MGGNNMGGNNMGGNNTGNNAMPVIGSLQITQDQIERLILLAVNELPIESCALLFGKYDKTDKVLVIDFLSMKNSDNSGVSFSIDPQQLLNAYSYAESRGYQVVGIFHSHPGDPYPSPTDKKYMEINPVVWLIYSTTIQSYRAFINNEEGKIKEVSIKIATE